MDDYLYTISACEIDQLQPNTKKQAITSLESGKVIYFPNYSFAPHPDEQPLLSESILDKKHKNISYDPSHHRVSGVVTPELLHKLQDFMHRFSEYSKHLIDTLLPEYTDKVRWGRTSYRPAEIKGRASSKRKDDTRLHVDSFSATPVNGLRILRVFCNINPYGEPRVWHVGEPFSDVLKTFADDIPEFSARRAKLLKLIKATKTLRSPYDHYMLHLHDTMKLDDHYQQNLAKQRIDFPANSTWIVFTDNVSHAALSGQFLLEQTFYLPVDAMIDPAFSPLKQWEKEKACVLA